MDATGEGTMYWKALATLGMSIAVVMMAGCGSGGGKNTHTVKGKVTFSDGSPLTKGIVVFASPGGVAQGEIQSDGSYSLGSYGSSDGAPAGDYVVYLSGPIFGPPEDAGSSEPAEEGAEMYTEGMEDQFGEALVHRKFSEPNTSGLSCNVSGATTFDITVEKPE